MPFSVIDRHVESMFVLQLLPLIPYELSIIVLYCSIPVSAVNCSFIHFYPQKTVTSDE